MQAIFSPAIALMNRLRYNSKFLLLGAAVSVVMVVLLYSVFSFLNRDIDTARQELAGLQMLKPINQMAQVMQQHRGLSSGVLNGNEAMREKRAAKEKEVAAAILVTDAALPPVLRDTADWKAIRSDWDAIGAQGLTWTAAENIKRHTQMIGKVLQFMVTVADETQLTLDPIMDTYYFMDTLVTKMPAMLEQLGVTRARGTGLLTKKEMSPQQRVDLSSVVAQMDGTLQAQNVNLEKVMRFSPALKDGLSGPTKEFSAGAEKIFALVREDILSEKYATAPQDYFAMVTQVIDLGYKVMYDTLMPQFERQLQERLSQSQKVLAFEVGLAVCIGLLVAYLGMGTYFSVINSVGDFSRGASRLADGDLTAKFDTDGVDELHAAGKDFNGMAAAFRSLLGGVQGDVRQLNQAAEQLALSSQQISAGTARQSDSATSMAAAVEEMTVGIDHISRNAQDAQMYSRESDEVATRGGQIVQSVVNEIQAIAQTVNDSAKAVEALGRQSEQISAIVGTIKEIADQTNLLALNAAIEAARAGESGRGFAVVADEVRKLAERTAKSTHEITAMIEAVQAGTTTAVSSMKQGVLRVSSGVAQAQLAGEAIGQVQAQSRQVLNAVSEITVALREQASASTDIAQNVERIAQMAEENSSAASGNANTSETLRKLAQGLTGAIARFRT
ncbi:methyl-accepting chemotaxis protein [Dechloromonas sp. HYN0024]|uniref:methyl-accepting chemotaxis protein n=1 Tax=Dechloromonas sp. HYN0024 TaxID=2231055 RepID=UPI000E433C72|nr:methyl-accepting chemotaxis protein [Dechloromonas sp. HYN0024]AXS80221.1 methyl-accepting chemotaxis protein [Dechloromonas sp. HYN0024]